MASTNERIVRRSNALLDARYGADFGYTECVRTSGGPLGWMVAAGMAASMRIGRDLLTRERPRRWAQKVMPAPGQGPSDKMVATGWFKTQLRGEVDGQQLAVEVHGRRDPGYGATAAMIACTATALARDELGAPGITTTAAGIGQPLIDRLNADGEVTLTVL